MKYLKVTMSDGTEWLIPADVIGKDRALYYADKYECVPGSTNPNHQPQRCEGKHLEIYIREYDVGMNDETELLDWAANNMNWRDVAQFARKISNGGAVDYVEDWVNADKQIVEMDE